jgi:uncharacterized protein (DUF302 family)
MSYYMAISVDMPFDRTVEKVRFALEAEGFGVLSDIDVKETMKKKLGEDFRKYRILGACNPPYAFKALQAENKIGTMLPCNVVVQELDDGRVEIAAVNPVSSMQSVNNPGLLSLATEIRERLSRVIESFE